MHRCVALALILVACGGKKSETVDNRAAAPAPAPAPAAPGDAAAPPPAVKLASEPVELSCGARPLAIPAATPGKPPPARELLHDPLTVCQDQASVAAACTCLASSVPTWATGLSAKVSCAPAPQGSPTAQLVELRSTPDDPDLVGPGTAYVLVGRHGDRWSAAGVADVAPDVDRSVTPKAMHGAKVTRFETRPRPDGQLVWIETEDQYSETDMGEREITGSAQLTICVVPTRDAPFCYAPVQRATWDYTFTIAKADRPDACKIREAASYSITLDAGLLDVTLDRGTDSGKIAGRYRL